MMKALLWLPLLALPLVYRGDVVLTICIFSFLLGMAAVSFTLLFGFTGQLSMFHAAAFGISSYVTYIVVSKLQVPFWLALPEFRLYVLGIETAHVAHGGEGALYVRLRRTR